MNYRKMEPTELGKPVDGLPIKPKDIFQTISGRLTTPFPKNSNLLYLHRWLIENAINEAFVNNDEYNLLPFRKMEEGLKSSKKKERRNLSQSDIAYLNCYLWSFQPKPVKKILRKLNETS